MTKRLLVVVDMQNDFITGSLESEPTQKVVPNVVNRIKNCIDLGYDILFTVDRHSPDSKSIECTSLPQHCIVDTQGCKIIPEIMDIFCGNKKYSNNVNTIAKSSFGTIDFCQYDGFIEFNEYSTIEIVGVATNICVLSIAVNIQAITKGETMILINEKCCASYDNELHEKALAIMNGLKMSIINEK